MKAHVHNDTTPDRCTEGPCVYASIQSALSAPAGRGREVISRESAYARARSAGTHMCISAYAYAHMRIHIYIYIIIIIIIYNIYT